MGGVYIYSDAVSEIKLRYAHFNKGDVGLHLDEIPYNEENLFTNMQFENNTTGLYVSKSSIEITSSHFLNCESGLIDWRQLNFPLLLRHSRMFPKKYCSIYLCLPLLLRKCLERKEGVARLDFLTFQL